MTKTKKKSVFKLLLKPRKLGRKLSRKITKHLPEKLLTSLTLISLSKSSINDYVPKRVVLVCGSLHAGGAERQLVNTMIGLKDSPLESVTLICDRLSNEVDYQHDFYLPLAKSSGWTVREINTNWDQIATNSPPELLWVLRYCVNEGLSRDVLNLYHEFKRLQPEIVHSWLDWSNIRAGLAAVLAGVPRIILSGRNVSPKHFLFNTYYMRSAYLALLKNKSSEVSLLNNSDAGAKDYAQWLKISPENIVVIRNGVEFNSDLLPTPDDKNNILNKIGVPSGKTIIGGMFRFYPEKDPLLWIKTAAHLAAVNSNLHFVLFGDGIMQPDLEKFISKHKLENRIHLFGKISPSLHGLSICDLVLLTSRVEGTPNVLLESQWLGIPVVTTIAGGAAESVSNNVTGAIAPSREPEDIAKVVLNCINDNDFLSNAKQKAPEFINSKFSLECMVRETLNVYARNNIID